MTCRSLCRGIHEIDLFGIRGEEGIMSSDRKKRDGRYTFKVWHLALAILLLLAGSVGLYIAVHRGDVERRLAALRAAGYPTSFAELAEDNQLPAGTPNAADVYERAFAAFVPPAKDANVPVLGPARLPDRGEPLPEPMAGTIAKCLAENQQCLALLHKAGGIADCRYDWDYASLAQGTPMPNVRHCALLLRLGTLLAAHTGDPNTAGRYVVDGLRLADSLRAEPALISYLVRIACVALAVGDLERSLCVTTFTDAQLRELGDALAATAGTLDLTEVLIGERCFTIEMYRDPSLLQGPGGGPPVHMLPGMRKMWLLDTLDYAARTIEASRLPPPERLARFRALEKEIEGLSFWHVMVKLLPPATTRVAVLDLRAHAHLDLARTALAVERYRLATGRLPETLADLVPTYLDRVPTDPFDGQPVRYERLARGYLVYSVDEDGHDDGGRERDPKNRDAPCDLPFIVTR
jgi:hypothetical protein